MTNTDSTGQSMAEETDGGVAAIGLDQSGGVVAQAEPSNTSSVPDFDLPAMLELLESDLFLKTNYDRMIQYGKERYGYHFNETIANDLFRNWVLPVANPDLLSAFPEKGDNPKRMEKYLRIYQQHTQTDMTTDQTINDLENTPDAPVPMEPTPADTATGTTIGQATIGETTTSTSSGAYASPFAFANKGAHKSELRGPSPVKVMGEGLGEINQKRLHMSEQMMEMLEASVFETQDAGTYAAGMFEDGDNIASQVNKQQKREQKSFRDSTTYHFTKQGTADFEQDSSPVSIVADDATNTNLDEEKKTNSQVINDKVKKENEKLTKSDIMPNRLVKNAVAGKKAKDGFTYPDILPTTPDPTVVDPEKNILTRGMEDWDIDPDKKRQYIPKGDKFLKVIAAKEKYVKDHQVKGPVYAMSVAVNESDGMGTVSGCHYDAFGRRNGISCAYNRIAVVGKPSPGSVPIHTQGYPQDMVNESLAASVRNASFHLNLEGGWEMVPVTPINESADLQGQDGAMARLKYLIAHKKKNY